MYVDVGEVSVGVFAEMCEAAESADIAPGPGGSRITPIGLRWAGKASVVALYPSAQLVAHCDPPIQGMRYHIPLIVNPGCWVFSSGQWQQLRVGRVYAMDPTQIHGAVNWGPDRRLHLLLDIEGDAWPPIVLPMKTDGRPT